MNRIFNKEEFKQDKGNKIISTNKMYVMNAKPISPALLQGGMVKCNYILWFLSDELKKGNNLKTWPFSETLHIRTFWLTVWFDKVKECLKSVTFLLAQAGSPKWSKWKRRDFVHVKVAHCPVANGGQLMHQHWSGQRCPVSS